MKLNYLSKQLSTVGRCIATTLLCVSVFAFVWQGTYFANTTAIANPTVSLIASTDAGNLIQSKASKDAGQTKNFIRDTANKVEETAKKNANRIEQATNNNSSFVERKAQRDAKRIEQRAEQDANRTQKAVDKTKNAVERTVDNIKDTFNK